MASKGKTPSISEEARGFAAVLRESFKTGLNVGEDMQRGAMEVPLAIMEGFGVSKENTDALRKQNRDLVHAMSGAVETMAGRLVEVGGKLADAGTEQAKKVGEAVEEAVSKASKG